MNGAVTITANTVSTCTVTNTYTAAATDPVAASASISVGAGVSNLTPTPVPSPTATTTTTVVTTKPTVVPSFPNTGLPPIVSESTTSQDPLSTLGFNAGETPMRLLIPAINLDASIGSVGLTKKGAVDAPNNPSDTAWFNLGTRPGEQGNAVIVGHFGWKNNVPAVFDKLSSLHPGDKLYVQDAKGTVTTFVVRTLREYGANEKAPEVFDANATGSHLNLITCEGTWNSFTHSYSGRLVIFTDKE